MEHFNILYTVMKMLLNFIESNKEINCQPQEPTAAYICSYLCKTKL